MKSARLRDLGRTTAARTRRGGRARALLPVGTTVRRGPAGGGAAIANDVVLNQVLVGFCDDAHTDRVLDAVQRDGTCWMSGTTWRGRRLMRISVSNWSTTEADVDRSAEAILRLAEKVVTAPPAPGAPAIARSRGPSQPHGLRPAAAARARH